MPAERAAAVTGDFLEEAESRGPVWFWSSVFRLVSSTVWNQWKESPLELAGVGVLGFVLNFVATALCSLCLAVLAFPVLWLLGWARDESAYGPVMVLASWAAAYSTGRWIRIRAPGREVAVCLALGIVPVLILGGVLATIPFWGMEKISFQGVRWSDVAVWCAAVFGALKSDGRKPAAQG
jgi:hypothetical protein